MGVGADGKPRSVNHIDIVHLLENLVSDGLDFIKTEHLCEFDGEPGFALGQGQ
jgi:isocitrate dehydrogenase